MHTYFRLLRRYGVLVHDVDGLVEKLQSLPQAREGETFHQWKTRLFGTGAEGLKIFQPVEPRGNTLMKTLARESGEDYLLWALKDFRGMSKQEVDVLVNERVDAIMQNERERHDHETRDTFERAMRQITTVPTEMLEDIIEEFEGGFEPSVQEFLNRYLEDTDRGIRIDEMLRQLLTHYNIAVRQVRRTADG
jgi:hypothetical protein